ncbi:MAG: hypothetical protein CSA70_01355 [Rhodobacterales bacterium]|nr:MAG: hypothetical protein CSA70_01355 [Rhodobacterales bacterium]
MGSFANINWDTAKEIEQLHAVRKADAQQLDGLMRAYDWNRFPESVLGWAVAQQGIGLSAAITAFFNADPMRFNYVPSRDIPAAHHGVCRLLDTICLRINAGFYLPEAEAHEQCPDRLAAWMMYQQEDAKEGRRGRWVFDPDLLTPMLEAPAPVVAVREVAKPRFQPRIAARMRRVVAPLLGRVQVEA